MPMPCNLRRTSGWEFKFSKDFIIQSFQFCLFCSCTMTFHSALSLDKASHNFSHCCLCAKCELLYSVLLYFNKYSGTLSESHLIHKQGSCYIIFMYSIFIREHWLSWGQALHFLSVLSVMTYVFISSRTVMHLSILSSLLMLFHHKRFSRKKIKWSCKNWVLMVTLVTFEEEKHSVPHWFFVAIWVFFMC